MTAGVIYRGSTPTITMKPTNGMQVSELGTPTVAISQDLTFLSWTDSEVTVDTSANSISVKLTEEETLSLVAGVKARIQEAWVDSEGNVVRFPIEELSVADTIMGAITEVTEETTEE